MWAIHVEYEEPGSFRPKANRDNDYQMDRQAQKENRAYSGIFGFAAQDYSLQESMGLIQDHEAEHLLPADKAIVMARRMLHEAAQGLSEGTALKFWANTQKLGSVDFGNPASIKITNKLVVWPQRHISSMGGSADFG